MKPPEIKFSQGTGNYDLTIVFMHRQSCPVSALNDDWELIENLTQNCQTNFSTWLPNQGWCYFCFLSDDLSSDINDELEDYRIVGFETWKFVQEKKPRNIFFAGDSNFNFLNMIFLEGFLLSAYQFDKYKNKNVNSPFLETIEIFDNTIDEWHYNELTSTVESVYFARDLVNEPFSYMTAQKLSEEISGMATKHGIDVKVRNKKQIKEKGFEALLAVNKGSKNPPTFTELTWRPPKAINERPIVLVGKGIVYDTGGLSLKSTLNNMDKMKSDMAGAAAVAGAMKLLALNNDPVHVVGLIPATDNMPGENAYAPGDVIDTYKGISVEVLNTDAEGRLIMADALAYAEEFFPHLTIDIATLTGSASATFGKHAAAMMSNTDKNTITNIEEAGLDTFEKVAHLPLWREYGELIESDIADIKNSVGNQGSGAIGAGKFLEHFAPNNWIHLDIAGTGYMTEHSNYRGIQGTGFGVRLLHKFIINWSNSYVNNEIKKFFRR